ncbi:glycosyltransferase family 2 protein [uncultured Cytophaga sp.]|uniref:glycosyltransferase family 2 protein n=1 Tax=uncultured Cytophaga sp. TaxID=160238 RepID=UPI002633A090|nr:glycosyltransferase family 2 protein [uncultured Cytophaga sp.]
MNNSTAIVILNWNGVEHLKTFLPSVVAHSQQAEIIIADNASTDNSIHWLKTNYPLLKIITLYQNYGYAGGYNEALKCVDAEYIVLLNSDVEVTAGWLDPLIHCLDNNPSIAACQPKIKSYSDKKYFEYAGAAGGYIDYIGIPFCKGRIIDTTEIDSNQYNESAPIFWASGACLFIRNAVFKKANGFDADFFAHMEEIDLCWKIHRLGYNIQYIAESTVYHLGGATLHKSNPKKTYLNVRNSLWMLQKHLPTNKLIPILFSRMLLDGVAALNFLRIGQGKYLVAIFNAHMSFYFSGKNKGKRKALSHLPYYYNNATLILKKSIIGLYYLKGKKTYSSIFK